MKKSVFFAVLLIFTSSTLLCSKPQNDTPQKVYRIVYEVRSDAWYATQANLWKKEIEKNPKNTEAWHNYYNAVRYASFAETIDTKSKQEKLQKIIDDMGKAIPGTYTYYFLRQWNLNNCMDLTYAQKAYEIDPDQPETYYSFISYYLMNGEPQKAKEFYQKLYQSKDIAPWLIDYNYNVLMSTDENAILFTNGDNDTYPAEMLQFTKNIRDDVTIINISMSINQVYLDSKFQSKGIKIDTNPLKQKAKTNDSERKGGFSKSTYIQSLCLELSEKYPDFPIYFALTVYENNYKPFKDDLYNVGLAFRYIQKRIDNIALIKKNIEDTFRLNYIINNWYSENAPSMTIMPRMNLNYVSGLMMLENHYELSGDIDNAQRIKKLALTIAHQAGNKELIEEIEK